MVNGRCLEKTIEAKKKKNMGKWATCFLLLLDPPAVFMRTGFWVPAMLRCCIFGFLQTKPLVLFPAFIDLVQNLLMHDDVSKILLKSV